LAVTQRATTATSPGHLYLRQRSLLRWVLGESTRLLEHCGGALPERDGNALAPRRVDLAPVSGLRGHRPWAYRWGGPPLDCGV